MKVKVKVSQSCPTLCDPIDYAVHEILQARILEWGSLSLLQGGLLNPGIEPRSPALQADSLPAEPPARPLPAEGRAKATAGRDGPAAAG